jgi:ketosteroid isomerase-like protein
VSVTTSTDDGTAARTLTEVLQGVLDDYVAAWIRGDQDAVLAHLSADAILLPHDGLAPITGRQAARTFWFGGRWSGGIDAFQFTLLGAHQPAPDVAVSWGTRHLRYWQPEQIGKVNYDFRGTVLLVFENRDSYWTITHFMWDDPPPERTTAAS